MSDQFPSGNTPVPAPGYHGLPLRFSAPLPPLRRVRRRLPLGVVLSTLGVIIAAVAFTGAQVGANLRFDDAVTTYVDARTAANEAKTDVDAGAAELASTTASAELLITKDTGVLLESVPLDDLTTAIEDATNLSSGASEATEGDIPAAPTKPAWFWELFATASTLDVQTSEANALRDDLTAQVPVLSTADETLTAAGITVITAAADAAPAFESSHLSARNNDVISLRTNAEAVRSIVELDAEAVERFGALQASAAAVVASQEAELAEKAGPLLNSRLEAEAFARSLAPGVLLEFDWAPVVSGAGYNGSMGGYTTWWWSGPDRAEIDLSHSVAEQWPSERSRALIAHEVGHAISVKCEGMYDSSTQDSIEKWATAWAISMGFTDDANGVWAYGYPPQSYIDAAAECR